MKKPLPIALLLACSLAISACGLKSVRSPTVCPVIPELPANLRAPLNAEQSLSGLLLESAEPATSESTP